MEVAAGVEPAIRQMLSSRLGKDSFSHGLEVNGLAHAHDHKIFGRWNLHHTSPTLAGQILTTLLLLGVLALSGLPKRFGALDRNRTCTGFLGPHAPQTWVSASFTTSANWYA